jgi:hypothetical protein
VNFKGLGIKVVVAYLSVLPFYSPGGTDKSQEKPGKIVDISAEI